MRKGNYTTQGQKTKTGPRGAAEQFLEALDPEAESFCFRVIRPDKTAENYSGSLQSVWFQLRRENREGAGAYIVVNEGGDSAEEITRIRAVFADLDGAPLEPIYECGLEPHIVVQSSPGKYHVYWLVDPGDPLPLDQFKGVQRAVARRFDGDRVHDLPRVLRLPGFYNHKYGESHRVRIIEDRSHLQPYKAAELLDEFPPIEDRGTRGERGGTESGEAFKEGQRNAALTSLAGSMRHRGFGGSAIRSALLAENQEKCDPPLDEDEVERIAASVSRYEPDPSEDRTEVAITGGGLPRMVEAADSILANHHAVFQRGTKIVRLARTNQEKTEQGITRPKGSTVLMEPSPAWLRSELTRLGKWVKLNLKEGKWKEDNAPSDVARTFLDSAGDWSVPVLYRLAEAPTLRPDGSLMIEPGYDRQTQTLLDHGLEISLPDKLNPSKAKEALDDLREVLSGFPFVDEVSESVALAGLLTAVIRPGLPTAPMHAFSAPTQGSGKSLLVDLCSVLATGRKAPVLAMGESGEEFEKRLGSALLAGDSIISLDNVERPLASELLCQCLTQEQVGIRILGKSEKPILPTNAAFYATGNNLRLSGDMVRRALLCRLDPESEHPDQRRFDFDPLAVMEAERSRYVTDVLTLLRAYVKAGEPKSGGLRPFGSFEQWSRFVRGPLVWLGMADPLDSAEHVREADPVRETLRTVMAAWYRAREKDPITVGELVEESEHDADLREALVGAAGDRRDINRRKLGYWLKKHQGRIIDGYRIEAFGKRLGVTAWRIRFAD